MDGLAVIPLRLALLHRGSWYRGKARVDGQFAYEVEGLEWVHHVVDKQFTLDVSPWKDVDVLWLDDGKYHKNATLVPPKGQRISPLVYYVLYPTLAHHLYEDRLAKARQWADLVLLDHDDLGRWQDRSFQARRLAYSVNDHYYRDRGLRRDIDVGYYAVWGHNRGRKAFEAWLGDFCARKGYRFYGLKGESVKTEYANLLARTKVVVHLSRTAHTRPPRIFDAAASGAATLSNPMPEVSGECWLPWVHYAPFREPQDVYQERAEPWPSFSDEECAEVIAGLEWLLDEGHWEPTAQAAKQYVMSCHTWERRAVELRGILLDCFPQLREKAQAHWMYRP
jgi:hypothetical protein